MVFSQLSLDDDQRKTLSGSSSPIGEQSGLFVAVLAGSGETIGTFSLEDGRDDLELSYQLLPEYWGRGLAFEAAEALLNWGWKSPDITSIIAVTQSSNDPSLRLLTRLGFEFDSNFDEYGRAQTQMRLSRPTETELAARASRST